MADRSEHRKLGILLTLTFLSVTVEANHRVGCYQEIPGRHFYINPGVISPDELTPRTCVTACSKINYEYAAVKAGRFCFCANDPPPSSLSSEPGVCDTPCSGDNTHTCGSWTHVEVYQSPPPIVATLTVPSNTVVTGEKVQLSAEIDSGAGVPNYVMKMDYGDTAGETYFTQTEADILSNTYYMSGEYDIRGYVTNIARTLDEYDTATSVKVWRPVQNARLVCPSRMVTFDDYSCRLTVEKGTGMAVDVYYDDGDKGPSIYKTFEIADATEASMGNFVQQNLEESIWIYTSTVENAVATLHPYYPAQYDGVILGFEFYANNLGNISLQVYQPECASGEYCYDTNACQAVGTCGYSCDREFCSADQNCCKSTVTRPTALPAPKYKLVHSISVYIDQTGPWYVPANLSVQTGDIIGHQIDSSYPIIATTSSPTQNYYDYYCRNVFTDVDSNDCAIMTEQHMIRAIYVGESITDINLTFTDDGNVTIDVDVFNSNGLGNTEKLNANAEILMGVNATIYSGPTCVEMNQKVNFTLEPFTGHPVEVEWNFGNGDIVETNDGNVIYSYPDVGLYNFTTNVSNAVSYRFNHTLICVQEMIRGLQLYTTSTVIEIGVVENITIFMSSGTNYTCNLTFSFADKTTSTINTTDSDDKDLSFVFSIPGMVDMTVACSNNISHATANYKAMAVERISGVALRPGGAIARKEFHLVLNWTSGTHISLNFTYNGEPMNLQIDEAGRTATSGPLLENDIGVIPVTYSLENPINAISSDPDEVFVIEMPITNPIVTCNVTDEILVPDYPYIVVQLNTDIICSVNMTNGTSADIYMDWDDGTFWNEQVEKGEQFDEGMFSFPTNHTFTNVNLHSVGVTVSNSFNSYTKYFYVMVMVPVDGLILQPVAHTVPFDPPAVMEFVFTLPPGSTPNMVNLNIDWGDGTSNTYTDIDLFTSITRNYTDRDGDLTVSYTLYNLISSVNRTFPIYIVAPIKNMRCYVEPAAGEPGVALPLMFQADRAPPAGVLDLTFDCDTSILGTLPTRKRMYNSPFGKDTENCTYAVPGNYTMSIRAQSKLDDVTCTHQFEVLNTVTDDFDIFTNAPIDMNENLACIVSVSLSYLAIPTPDNAYVVLSYGDNTTQIYDFDPALTVTHTYATDGNYVTTIRIWNDAVEITRNIRTGCYKNFTYTDFTVLREPLLPVGSPDEKGYGSSFNRYRTDENLKIYTTLSKAGVPEKGTFVFWDITAVSGSNIFTCNSTEKDLITWMIEEPGVYDLTLTPNNPLFTGPSITKTIEMFSPSGGIHLNDYGVTNAYATKRINVTMDYYGTGMCVAVNYGDIPQVVLYGNPVTCGEVTVTDEHFPGIPTQFDPSVDVTTSFMLEHQYKNKGTYTLELLSWNALSYENVTYEFPVTDIDCSAPNVDIDNRAKNFMYPIKCKRSKRCKIVGRTDIACPETLKNTKQWRAFTWDKLLNTMIAEVDISPTRVPSSINSELSLNPLVLPYGLYKLKYTVSMTATSPSGEKFSGIVETFLEIVESDLVIKISNNAMTEKSVGPNEILTICPSQYSYDPDVNVAGGEIDRFDGFDLACRDMTNGEEFPDENVTISIYDAYIRFPNFTDTGGCFGSGPGWMIQYSGCTQFYTSVLKPDHQYEFLIKGRKGDRQSELKVTIDVQSDTPPEVEIKFKIPDLCSPGANGQRFNPKSNLGLVGQILNPNPVCSYSDIWKVYAYDYQYCEYYDCWRYLQYMGQKLEGATTAELTIHREVFSHYSDVNSFKVHLTTECYNIYDGTSTSGSVAFNLYRNTPPKDGTCTISPTNGTAATTKFQINCHSFIDDDDSIVDYTISCLALGKTWAVVAGGNQKLWTGRTLPAGDSNNTNILRCKVAVKDDLGSFDEYYLHEIQVHPVSANDYMNSLLNSQNSEGDEFDIMEAVANLDDTASLGAVTAAVLESINEEFENGAMAGMGSVLSYASTPLNAPANASRTAAFTKNVDDPEAQQKFEEMRDAAIKVVDQMLTTFKACTVESADETIRQAEVLASLSASVANLNRAGQGDVTSLLLTGVENAVKLKDSLRFEDAKNILEKSVAACANVIKSANIGKDFPANSDLLTQADTVPNFDSSMDSSLPDVGSFKNDQDALRDGMKILNVVDQEQFTGETLSKCSSMQDTLVQLLADKSPSSDQPVDMSSDNMAMKLYKSKPSQILNTPIESGGCKMQLPSDIFNNPDEEVVLVMKTTSSPGSPLEENGPVNAFSRELTIKVNQPDGTAKQIQNLATPVRIVIPQDPNKPKVDESMIDKASPRIVGNNEYFFYHTVNVTNNRSALQLVFRPTSLSYVKQLLVLVNYMVPPKIGDGEKQVQTVCMIPSDTYHKGFYGDDSEPDPYTCFVDADIIGTNTGTYVIGVRQLAERELNWYNTIDDLPAEIPDYWDNNNLFSSNYKFWPSEVTCAYTADGQTEFKSDGLKPHPLTTEDKLVCETFHFTTFAGGWAVAPNTIDWDFVFSNADFLKNPTLYVTEIVILLVYILAMAWARRKDKHDVEKLGLAPLPCNDHRDTYFYEILVSTGLRRGAGTESKVHFILSGDDEETEVRSFVDKKRKIFTRGSTDGFLMSVPYCLGDLLYLRIWHDNSGKGRAASWYLNHVVIRDIQTDKKYIFIADRWFAVEEDDGQVDRVIPTAGKQEMTEFSHLFAARATKNLSDGHLWFSVIARPPQSRFTRCQRVSCCLCLLFTSMLANAMFYGTETSDANAFQFGPFALTSEQIFIGVVCNIIIFPVNLLLITLFRKSRPRKLRPSRFQVALQSQNDPYTTSITDVNPRVNSSLEHNPPGSSFLMETKRSASATPRPESAASMSVSPNGKKGKKKFELPWWFTIIAWIILCLTVLVSAAFVTFYGIMFQDIKCKKWITSMLISFFTSVFLTQPIKVFLLAIIFSVIVKNPSEDEDDESGDEEVSKTLENDEEYLHKEEEDEFSIMAPKKASCIPKPPDPKTLESAREQRLKERKMWAVIREIIFYAFFLWILMVISYKSVSSNSYNYKHNMEKVFILTNDTNKAFSRIKNTNDFWSWAKSGMLRGLRAGPYYNNFPPFYMRGYINDKQSRLMGYAVLRQVRTIPDTCKVPILMDGIIEECNGLNDIRNEENLDFGTSWTPLDVNNSREEYQFKTASELNGYPFWGVSALYGGGGYIVKLNKGYFDMIKDLEQLQNENWIDKYTRAVFLEFTVYNPSINLFAISTLTAEFRPSGGVFTSFRFEPCILLPYMSSALLFQIACEIIYLGFTLYFVIILIKSLIKQKSEYFLQFWNLVDLGTCAMSVTAIVIYFYRLLCINELTKYFNETSGNGYMKFQYVGFWSELFNYIIGFLVFFATLKFLKLLRFNRKISMLSDTLKNSSKELIHFSIIFNVVFLAFMQVFYLVYMSHLDMFKSFVGSCEAGIVMMMGKFDIYSMLEVNQWLTQLFIFLFVVTITFIVVNMLLSILNDTFSAVRSDTTKQQNDYEIVDFMMSRFRVWTGVGKANPTISPADENKKPKSIEEKVNEFPDQIDRFLASISNMYANSARFESFLHDGMTKQLELKPQHNVSNTGARSGGAQHVTNEHELTNVQTD